MRTELFGEMREGRDGEMGEEMRGCFEEDLEGLVKAAEVGIWSCAHFIYMYSVVYLYRAGKQKSSSSYVVRRDIQCQDPRRAAKLSADVLPLFAHCCQSSQSTR